MLSLLLPLLQHLSPCLPQVLSLSLLPSCQWLPLEYSLPLGLCRPLLPFPRPTFSPLLYSFSVFPFAPYFLPGDSSPFSSPRLWPARAAPSSSLHGLPTHWPDCYVVPSGAAHALQIASPWDHRPFVSPAQLSVVLGVQDPQGERVQFWKETGWGWDLALGRRPRLLRGALGGSGASPPATVGSPPAATEMGG